MAKILTVSRKSHHPIETLYIEQKLAWGQVADAVKGEREK